MEHPEYLENMPTFKNKIGKIVYSNEQSFNEIVVEWSNLLKNQHHKGLIPLFITGCGVSTNENTKVPTILKIIEKLKEFYDTKDKKIVDVDNLFTVIEKLGEKRDRSVVARLLNTFQQNKSLKEEWKKLNGWLLGEILNAEPTLFHKKLAELYVHFGAICLTLNFDGLLIREFIQYRKNGNERAFSLPTKEECERFFLRNHIGEGKVDKKEFLEVQIRGDILYITCDSEKYCPQKERKHSLWTFLASHITDKGSENKDLTPEVFLKCPSCGETGCSLLSFPGSYDKEKDMKDMLEVIWKYLAYRVGSVTVVGMSGEWDPLIVAFLGDLLSEREIPLIVVDKYPEVNETSNPGNNEVKYKYIIRELVKPKIHYAVALKADADNFMKGLTHNLGNNNTKDTVIKFDSGVPDDEYWYSKVKNTSIKDSINLEFSTLENDLKNILQKEGLKNYAQLGLKSYWLGIDQKPSNKLTKYHNRYNHSLGVMKIASYLYDKAIGNTSLGINIHEKQFLRLAALLHDVGHLPFSHLIEDVFNELNWKPAGYKDSYSHVFQTNKKIEELFGEGDLRNHLKNIGYDVSDIIKLVNGCFGVGYLDAIINSPLDADKIDYVFRDTDSTGRRISLSPVQFLNDIVAGLTITPEKYLSFFGISAKTASELLQARKHLYQSLYLQPGIVILEGIVKLIIKTYFVHCLDLHDEETLKQLISNKKDYPDLGDYKISYCVNKLQDLLREAINYKNEDNLELKIVISMVDKIKERKKYLNPTFFDNLNEGLKTIKIVNDEDKLKKLESKIVYKRPNGQKDVIKEVMRDVMLRMPGAAIIELSRLPGFLSTADIRKEKERSDGTKTVAECILVPDGNYEIWTSSHKATKAIHDSSLNKALVKDISVYLYPLSGDLEDSYFKQTENLLDKLLEKRGISTRG